MKFEGIIQLQPVDDIFRWLELKRKTGILKVGTEAVEYHYYMSGGMIVTATSPRYHTTDSAENVRHLLADSLRLTEGSYSFVSGPLPEEISLVPLRLGVQQLMADIVEQSGQAAGATGSPVAGSDRPAEPFRPVETLQMAILDRLITDSYQVPVLPTVVRKIVEITRNDNYPLNELSRIIMADQVLTAHLLKQANSPIYASEREVDSIRTALQRLGTQAVVNMVLAISLQSAHRGRDIFLQRRKQIWRHSFACALMARLIAKGLRADAEMAFLGGLLMDFGMIVMLSLIQDVMKDDARLQRAPAGVIDGVLENYHCKVGGRVAEKWNLPTSTRETITFHHQPLLSQDYSTLAAIAGLSDILIKHFETAESASEMENADPVAEAESLVMLPSAEILGLSLAQMKLILEHGPECRRLATEFLLE